MINSIIIVALVVAALGLLNAWEMRALKRIERIYGEDALTPIKQNEENHEP